MLVQSAHGGQPETSVRSANGTSAGVAAPAWATEANWYQLSVPLFHNGSKENDPPGTKPWTATCEPKGTPQGKGVVDAKSPSLYGGDLQGLQLRLDYLKRLGINALILTEVFSGTVGGANRPVDVAHIDDSLGELDAATKGDSDAFTKTDSLLVAFLGEAHRAGFRVALPAPWSVIDKSEAADAPKRESKAMAATRRWMDPNNDSDPSDGVDGWYFQDLSVSDAPTFARWYREVKKNNADAVVISGDSSKFDDTGCDVFIDYPCDVFIDTAAAAFVELWPFFFGDNGRHSNSFIPATIIQNIQELILEAAQLCRQTASLTPGRMVRYLFEEYARTVLSDEESGETSPASARRDEEVIAELAVAFQHLAGSAPLTHFGDEVGMYAARECAGGPMWWNDLASAESKPDRYGLEFYALTKLMNQLRSRFAPLRSGDLRPVELSPQPASSDVLVFSRSLPGEKVIVVMNLGKDARTAAVPAGFPGQLVAVLSPQIRPGKVSPFAAPPQMVGGQPVPRLGVGSHREHTDKWGDVTLTLKPESVKLIVIGDGKL